MVTQLIYMSQPFGYDSAILAGILATARRKNPIRDITGALICRQDVYLQLIEGDAAAIDALYERIVTDDRHLEVTLLSRAEVADRLFPRLGDAARPGAVVAVDARRSVGRRDPRRVTGCAAAGVRARRSRCRHDLINRAASPRFRAPPRRGNENDVPRGRRRSAA